MASPYVYLIDDDEDDRDIFEMALRNAFPDVKCSSICNAIKALEELNNENRPDYIFIDLNMPRMSGKECLTALKGQPALSGIPAIIYTTSSHYNDIQELEKLGANHYLVKPDSLNKLTFVLKEILSGGDLPYLIQVSA
ncbi:MAG: response regulator [Bacteroidia bacterium]|jgi:CheY-like chemotaxis protein